VIDLKAAARRPRARPRIAASTRGRRGLVDSLLAADERRRAAISRADTLRGEQKALSKSVSTASPDERPAVLAKAKAMADEVKAAEAGAGDRRSGPARGTARHSEHR